jgi:hypothetical protein
MADFTALENALKGYVDQITQPLVLADASIVLSDYISARKAYENVNAGAASSYSDVRGSVNKRTPEEIEERYTRLYNRLMELLRIGGVSVQQTEISISYWDISGFGGGL